MSISILNRGASGGLKPELTVTAPAGSTIDLLQNGIIASTYTLGTNETEHTFVVELGVYTVMGTLGTRTSSVEVNIDVVGHYNAKIEYELWLYREGDECEDVTGGWVLKNGGGGSLVKNADHMILGYYSDTSGVETANRNILNPKYKMFCAEVKAEQTYFNSGNFSTLVSSTAGNIYQSITSTSYYVQRIDVSSHIGHTFYPYFYGQYWNQSNGKIYIKNVWLE